MADYIPNLDWASGPGRINPTIIEGTWLVCETSCLDSFYNEAGQRLVLPAGQKYKAKEDRNFRSALTVTTYWDEDQTPSYTVLEIKSPHMKAALKAVVPEYASFDIHLGHFTIRDEPRSIFLHREELGAYGHNLQESNFEAALHVHHLLSYMWDVLSDDILTFDIWASVSMDPGDLPHKLLWMIFKPGKIVFVRKPQLMAFVFESMSQSQAKSWTLKGTALTMMDQSTDFALFLGLLSISTA